MLTGFDITVKKNIIVKIFSVKIWLKNIQTTFFAILVKKIILCWKSQWKNIFYFEVFIVKKSFFGNRLKKIKLEWFFCSKKKQSIEKIMYRVQQFQRKMQAQQFGSYVAQTSGQRVRVFFYSINVDSFSVMYLISLFIHRVTATFNNNNTTNNNNTRMDMSISNTAMGTITWYVF